MFPLSFEPPPADRDALATALREGLQRLVRLPGDRDAVRLEGGDAATPDLLRMDLTGADVLTRARLSAPPVSEGGGGELRARRFEVAAHPLLVEGARVGLDLGADEADFALRTDRDGNGWLVLVGGREGRAEVHLAGADFEALLLAGLKAGAARQGIRIEGVRWALRPLGSRAVGLDLWIDAARRVVLADVRATVRASGRVEIDDRLDATVRDLRVEGEGPVGGVVANLAAPYLRRYDGRTVSLTGLPLGVELRDVRVDVADGLHVTAAFG